MRNNRLRSLLSSVCSAVLILALSLAAGYLMLLLTAYFGHRGGEDALSLSGAASAALGGLRALLRGGWQDGFWNELLQAAPLILTGLAAAFAWKAGLYNLGTPGQYLWGALGFLAFAGVLTLPWYLCLLGAALAGALWGAVAGLLKARFRVSEAISTLILNFVALYGVSALGYAGDGALRLDAASPLPWAAGSEGAASYFFQLAVIALAIALFAAPVLWLILNKTVFGFELRAFGASDAVVRYAGVKEKKMLLLPLAIAGALAGLGGAVYYLTGGPWDPQDLTGLSAVGFGGLAAALLASGHPAGTVLCCLFIAHITAGGSALDARLFPPEAAGLIPWALIFLCAAMTQFNRIFSRRKKGGR